MALVEEVIVIAPTYPGSGGGGGDDMGYGWSAYTVDEFQTLQNMGYYPPSHVVKIQVDQSNLQAARQAQQKLAQHIARLDPIIRALPANSSVILTKPINTPSGQINHIPTNQIIDRWTNAHFTVTDTNYGTGRGGQAVLTPNTGVSEMSAQIGTINGYSASSCLNNEGMNYYLLHELAHVTDAVWAVHIQNSSQYYANNGSYAGYDDSSSLFRGVEIEANWASRDISGQLGLPFLQNNSVPYGF